MLCNLKQHHHDNKNAIRAQAYYLAIATSTHAALMHPNPRTRKREASRARPALPRRRRRHWRQRRRRPPHQMPFRLRTRGARGGACGRAGGRLFGQLCGRVCGQGEGGGAAQCRHGIKVLGLASHFSHWPARRGRARAFAAAACEIGGRQDAAGFDASSAANSFAQRAAATESRDAWLHPSMRRRLRRC